MFVRPVIHEDLPLLMALFKTPQQIGITSIPQTRENFEKKLFHSMHSFDKAVKEPENELYFFVVEERHSKDILATAAIQAKTGVLEPHFFFRKEIISKKSPFKHIVTHHNVLRSVCYHYGPSELCSLFVDPKARKQGIGTLLLAARFLFIASNPERFTRSIIGVLRGVIDHNLTSPFWNGIGKHFFNVSLAEAFSLTEENKELIQEFLPEHPIYIDLLPKEVQDSIGKTHSHSISAYSMLQSNGFLSTSEVDVFDAGPKLSATIEKVPIVKESILSTVITIRDQNGFECPCIIATNSVQNFRACYASVFFQDSNSVVMDRKTASMLSVTTGDTVRIFPLTCPREKPDTHE